MAMNRCAGCPECLQLQQEMKQIPASCIPFRVMDDLSKILDPIKPLVDRDYRSFADRSGLTPLICQWLDSKKDYPKCTSSIQLILGYLIAGRGNKYTVYDVFSTLYAMDSDGVNVILDGMHLIRQMYNGGSREGQEHAESLTNLTSVAASLSRVTSAQSARADPGSVLSEHVVISGSEHGFNDLGDANQPGHSRALACECEDSYHSTHTAALGSENIALCEENSTNFDGMFGPYTEPPPSYMQSQREYKLKTTQILAPTTVMEELKLPLPEAQMLNEEQHVSWSIIQRKTTDENTNLKECKFGSRPESFPQRAQLRPKCPQKVNKRYSDGHCADHSGACNCSYFVSPFGFDTERPQHSHCVNQSTQHQPSLQQTGGLNSVSVGVLPWNDQSHQTNVKMPLPSDHIGVCLDFAPSSCPDSSIISSGSQKSSRTSNYFVFILAGDKVDQKIALGQELEALSKRLKDARVHHVILSSATKWPMVKLGKHILNKLPLLTTDPACVSEFVQSSLEKAAKVVMLVSPGYYTYADMYAKGAMEHTSKLQAQIRLCHKTVKDEWFRSKKCLRILPVLLTNMKAVQANIPSFLIGAKFYCFSSQLGSDSNPVVQLLNAVQKC